MAFLILSVSQSSFKFKVSPVFHFLGKDMKNNGTYMLSIYLAKIQFCYEPLSDDQCFLYQKLLMYFLPIQNVGG